MVWLVLLLGASCVVAQTCDEDLIRLVNGSFRRADLMHDATGKGNYGYLAAIKGYFDPGKWTVCQSMMGRETDASQYCYIHLNTGSSNKPLAVGACVPASCTAEQLESLPPARVAVALRLPTIYTAGFTADCTAPTGPPWGTWVLLSVYILLILLAITGTLLDAHLTYGLVPCGGEPEADSLHIFGSEAEEAPKKDLKLEDKSDNLYIRLLLSFSLTYNYKRLVAPSPPGSFDSLNGVRVIATTFVVIGHTFFFLWDTMAIMNFQSVANSVKNFRFQIVVAGFYAVDTFFFLSGFLVAYFFVQELKGRGFSWKTLGMFYFHRIYRLTPSLVMGMFFFWLFSPYWNDGPWWMFYQKYVNTRCDNGWWYTLLYIQNWVNTDKLCMGWTWYLADDMQYYILSPLVLIAYWKNKYVGWGISVVGIWLCMAITLYICISNKLQEFSGIQFGAELGNYIPPEGKYGKLIYLPPYTRVAPYLIGFCAAFILTERGEKFAVSRPVRGVIYVASTIIVLILSFISWSDANYGWAPWMNYVWITISRPIWSVGFGSLLLLCVVGYGGIFSTVMSQGFWVPLARLSYGAYIFHLTNIGTIYNGYKSGLTYSFSTGLYFFLGHLIIAFALALVNFLLVEKPLMNMESLLLHRKPRAKVN